MTATMHATHRGSPLVTSTRALPVVIGIVRDAQGKPDGLYARAGTHAEPTIYWARDPVDVKHARALEVLWLTVDLRKGETIHIRPKAHQQEFFSTSQFELDEQHRAVTSGPVDVKKMAHKHGHRHEWSYDVVLRSDELPKALTLDPVIIIEEEH